MLFRQRRLRALSERECYLRLHGSRSGDIELLEARSRPAPPAAPAPTSAPEAPAPDGPTECGPALHLVFNYPRGAGTLTGEQLRRELLRRMQGRAGEAA